MIKKGEKWSEKELIITLALYFKLPFGKLNHCTKEVKDLAKLIGRTDNSVALRLSNFAACDPYIIESGRHGMSAGVKVCQPIWDRYVLNKEKLYLDASLIQSEYEQKTIEQFLQITNTDLIGKERESLIKQRVNQNVFRQMILNNYNNQCAITSINDSRLLIASHIVPWSVNKDIRLNPDNGICLSVLYDKAFDEGLITIRCDDYTVEISNSLKYTLTKDTYVDYFAKFENKKIILPEEHSPNKEFLLYHNNNIFIK